MAVNIDLLVYVAKLRGPWANSDVRFSNRALMSSLSVLWHSVGRVLAWVTLLFAVGTGSSQPLQA
jgi:hypothetical protein